MADSYPSHTRHNISRYLYVSLILPYMETLEKIEMVNSLTLESMRMSELTEKYYELLDRLASEREKTLDFLSELIQDLDNHDTSEAYTSAVLFQEKMMKEIINE